MKSKTYFRVEIDKPEKETDKAWGVDLGEQKAIERGRSIIQVRCLSWLPKSLCKVYEDNGNWYADCPKWIGDKLGFGNAVKHGRGQLVSV